MSLPRMDISPGRFACECASHGYGRGLPGTRLRSGTGAHCSLGWPYLYRPFELPNSVPGTPGRAGQEVPPVAYGRTESCRAPRLRLGSELETHHPELFRMLALPH